MRSRSQSCRVVSCPEHRTTSPHRPVRTGNKPKSDERARCLPWFVRELARSATRSRRGRTMKTLNVAIAVLLVSSSVATVMADTPSAGPAISEQDQPRADRWIEGHKTKLASLEAYVASKDAVTILEARIGSLNDLRCEMMQPHPNVDFRAHPEFEACRQRLMQLRTDLARRGLQGCERDGPKERNPGMRGSFLRPRPGEARYGCAEHRGRRRGQVPGRDRPRLGPHRAQPRRALGVPHGRRQLRSDPGQVVPHLARRSPHERPVQRPQQRIREPAPAGRGEVARGQSQAEGRVHEEVRTSWTVSRRRTHQGY